MTRRGKHSPTAIDFFSGAGGLSLGFRLAGFQILAAIEQHSHAAVTYAQNHPSTAVWCQSVQSLNPVALRNHLGLRRGELFAIIGGPPCQGFSESNRRDRTLSNRRNHLYKHLLDAVAEFKPQWVVIENVAGILTLKKGEILKRIVRGLQKLSYEASWHILDASEFGVPQRRRRVFIVANRKSYAFKISKSGRPCPSVRDAIGDLPRLPVGARIDVLPYATAPSKYAARLRGKLERVSGNLVSHNSVRVRRRYRYIKPGHNWKSIPPSLMKNYTDRLRCHTGIYRRLKWDHTANVVGNFRKNMLLHPRQHRGLSVREAARIQSFPDWYRFAGTIGFQQQQVADAVPPFLAKAVASAILRADASLWRQPQQ